MRACEKCLENNWSFQFLDGLVTATCQQCGNEVIFEAKKKIPVDKEGDLCRHCNTPVVLKTSKFNKKKLKKAYYYTAYLQCPTCKAMYMNDRWKVVNEKICQQNIQEALLKFSL